MSGSSVRHCTHDIPVTLIPRKHWSDFKEPVVQKFDVSIYLPDIKRLKHIAERYKNLDNTVVLQANRSGELRFTLDNQRVTVGTYFKNLETPPFIDDNESTYLINRGNTFTNPYLIYRGPIFLSQERLLPKFILILFTFELFLDNTDSEGEENDQVGGKRIRLAGNIPHADSGQQKRQGKKKSAELFCDVRVDLKKLLLYLGADNIVPKRTLANFVQGKLIHLFLIHDNICVQYLLPAIFE